MIVHSVVQGSDAWLALRRGMPTASEFGRILTPGGKLSEGSVGYMCELLASRMLGQDVNADASQFMQRGSAMEQEAVNWFELQRGVDTERVGFVTLDNGLVGCSPDRFVGEDEGLEVKVPSAAVHVLHMLEGIPAKYKPQVQGCLWITGRKRWSVLSYNPDMAPALVTVERDEPYIAALSEAVAQFLDRMAEAERKLGLPERRAA